MCELTVAELYAHAHSGISTVGDGVALLDGDQTAAWVAGDIFAVRASADAVTNTLGPYSITLVEFLPDVARTSIRFVDDAGVAGGSFSQQARTRLGVRRALGRLRRASGGAGHVPPLTAWSCRWA